MKRNCTIALCLFLTALLYPQTGSAQFFKFMPGESNYLRGNVKSELGGLNFTYRLQDDSTLALKSIIVRTDNSGQVLQTLQASSNFGSYTAAPDTTVIITGGGSTTAGNRFGLIQKLDKTGAPIWKKTVKISSADVGIGNIMVGADNTIFATISRSSFISSTYYTKSAVAAFDANGQQLWINYYSASSLTTDYGFSRTILAANGDFIGVVDVRGASGASKNGMIITRISPQGTIIFSKYIDFIADYNQLSVTGLVETPSKDIIFGGRLMTDQISTTPNTMWLGRLDAAGNMVQQKVYSGGKRFAEQLHSLSYANGKLYAYLHAYSPFDSVTSTIWVGTVDEQSLAITAHNSTALQVSLGDPYGNVSDAFCISSDGKPTVAAGFYCTEKDRYFPVMQQWSATLASSCAALDKQKPIQDSAAIYVSANYTSQGSFSVTYANDTTTIALNPVAPVGVADLCGGCSQVVPPTAIAKIANKEVFRVYPNPGDGRYFVDLINAGSEAQIAITNNIGATVYQANVIGAHHTIDLHSAAPGIYFARVRTADGHVATTKLIKDR